VRDVRLELEQVLTVLRVVPRALDVVAGKAWIASSESQNEMNRKCVSPPEVRRSTSTPRLPGVARHSVTPVRRRYAA